MRKLLSLLWLFVLMGGGFCEPVEGKEVKDAAEDGLMSPASSIKEIAEAQEALKVGDVSKAQKILRPISLGGEAKRHEAVLRLAQVYYAEGNLRDAHSLCEKATENTVSRYLAQTYCILGNVYERQENAEEALLAYLRVCLLFPTSKFRPEALFKAANAFEALGRTDRAQELREELERDCPKSPYAARLQRGQTQEKEGVANDRDGET